MHAATAKTITIHTTHPRVPGSEQWTHVDSARFNVQGTRIRITGRSATGTNVEIEMEGETLMGLMRDFVASQLEKVPAEG